MARMCFEEGIPFPYLFESPRRANFRKRDTERFYPLLQYVWRYWVSVWPYLYIIWEVEAHRGWWAEEALNGNWGKSPGLALLFPGNVQGFLCPGRDEWVIVFMRSRDSGPACPHYSGWNGGHHRAKEGMDVLGSFGKGPLRPSLVQGSDTPPSKRVFATWALEHLSGVKKTKFSWVHIFKI